MVLLWHSLDSHAPCLNLVHDRNDGIRCRVERSLLWEITGNLAATGNDLRVGKQLLFSKPKIVVKQPSSTVPTLKTRGLLVVSNAEKAYKPPWYLPLAQNPW